MKPLTIIFAAIAVLSVSLTPPQRKISEMTLVYDYSTPSGDATHTVYIKGGKSRSEITSVSPAYTSTMIFDASTSFGVILREVSGQKLLIRMNPDNWKERNNRYEGMVYKPTGETREIAGYKCIKATAQTKTGTTISVFYTKDIVPENKEYDPPFHNLDGLPLEYELANGDLKIKYRISKISLNPVPASKFDIPKSGYREMNYEEGKKIGGDK